MAEEVKDPGSGIVIRGVMLFVFLLLLLVGSYYLFFRHPQQVMPTAVEPAERILAQTLQPAAPFPATVQWGHFQQLANSLPSAPGWQIRYTAARALARRGSDQVPWDVFAEILDENRQFSNFRVKLPDGKTVSDEAAARQIVLSGLRAVGEWREKRQDAAPSGDLLVVLARIDALADTSVPEIKSQAEKTRAAFKKS